MISSTVTRASAGCVVAACLTAGSVLAAQRPAAADASAAVVPFTIHVPDEVLDDLQQRLARTRFADEISGAGWDYGTSPVYLRELMAYWRDRYDWRAQEQRLNQFDQFTTEIDGLAIHFVHQRSSSPDARPLLLLNGWPSSLVEYTKVIGPLTDPVAYGGRAEDAYHVVIPAMPGYGFSDKPRERGYNPERIAGMWRTLMARLGYTSYYVHGSDLGSAVASYLALEDRSHMLALHAANCGGAPATAPAAGAGPPAPPLVSDNLGYQEIQTTRPQTIGQSLSDSPVGLAAWIIDKWYAWTDHTGDLEQVYTKDELLTNLMFYWVTNSGASSARLYYELRHVDGRLLPSFGAGLRPSLPGGYVEVPTGCGAFPSQWNRYGAPINTDVAAARKGAAARYNVVHYTISPRGGHFPALEQPQVWLDDLRTFLRERRQAP